MATARLALFCPTMYLSSSATICLGVRSSVISAMSLSLSLSSAYIILLFIGSGRTGQEGDFIGSSRCERTSHSLKAEAKARALAPPLPQRGRGGRGVRGTPVSDDLGGHGRGERPPQSQRKGKSAGPRPPPPRGGGGGGGGGGATPVSDDLGGHGR